MKNREEIVNALIGCVSQCLLVAGAYWCGKHGHWIDAIVLAALMPELRWIDDGHPYRVILGRSESQS